MIDEEQSEDRKPIGTHLADAPTPTQGQDSVPEPTDASTILADDADGATALTTEDIDGPGRGGD